MAIELNHNLKLAICAALQQQGLLPKFSKKTWYKKTLGTSYNDTAKYNYSAQEPIREWYLEQPVEKYSDKITAISWAPDSEPITDIWTYWDGEDETFTIRDLAGIEHCKDLKLLQIESLLECNDLSPLLVLPALASVHLTNVIIPATEQNKYVVGVLQKRGVNITITTAKKDALTAGEQPQGPQTIEIPPVAPEQCIEILNALFPKLVAVVRPDAEVDMSKLTKKELTAPLFMPGRTDEEKPNQTKIETRYNEQGGAIQYHNFTSIVRRKDGAYSQADIRAMVHLVPNKTDLLEINLHALPKADPSKIEKIYFSTRKLADAQTQQARKLVREAFGI